MKAISRWLDRFCYNHPNFGIPNLMKFIVIGNVLVYFLDMFSRGYVYHQSVKIFGGEQTCPSPGRQIVIQ